MTNWPKPELNHGVVAYAYRPTRAGLEFIVWDPNDPQEAGLLTFDLRERRFEASRLYDTEVGPIRAFRMYLLVVAVTATAPVLEPATGTPRWYTHRLNRPAVYRAGAVLAGALPRPARLALARTLAQRAAGWFPTERARVRENVARVRPDLDAAARERLVGEVFRHFAICFADLISTNREARPERLLTRVEGDEHLLSVLADGRGLVLVTAHLGNWELGGRLIAARLRRPTHVVVAAEADPGVERFLRGGESPIRFVRRGDPRAMLALVGALRRGEVGGPAGRSRARHARRRHGGFLRRPRGLSAGSVRPRSRGRRGAAARVLFARRGSSLHGGGGGADPGRGGRRGGGARPVGARAGGGGAAGPRAVVQLLRRLERGPCALSPSW